MQLVVSLVLVMKPELTEVAEAGSQLVSRLSELVRWMVAKLDSMEQKEKQAMAELQEFIPV